ncbi:MULTISPECIES: zinc transporter ZntB [Francisella]|uniref:Zinc transporter ZntB n=1 Tax=Francisella opportunistica TaxID=2016517 RepID=A0A345JP42_9GAMM|nr:MULTISPECIES: zinc transporter ZntB [Francisella]APC90743.1 Magnesium and cobalt transport protein CorA [Francisella sp. MA067296]AXH29088.1 zinc transporter ZntB [Francisella opportunistica]AXH30740.1 zinc transporter ZntB [Francisella opportunistica]AXH32386.1 zinc transporter ZntB [Francisella opportunistica]
MNHILFCYCLDHKGGATSLEVANDIDKSIETKQNLVWTHLDAKSPQTKEWLNQQLSSLDPYIADALVAEETRPRFTQIDDGILIILRGINPNKDDTPEDMISIRLWIDKNRIISTRFRSLNVFDDITESFKNKIGPKNAADFITTLIAKLSSRMEPVLTDLDDRLVDIEEQTIAIIDTDLRESIAELRKQIIIFRRYIIPHRDVIEQLRLSSLSWLGSSHKRHLVEIYNYVVRYIEDLEEARDRLQIVKDEISNTLSDKLNKKMYFLSIIAAIFLPLSFLTGLLGVNVAGIPGAQNVYAFWIFLVILLVLVVLQIYLFKKLKWF